MRQEIRALQAGANALGLAPGREDGLWGPRNESGMRGFMAAHKGRRGDPVEEMHQAIIDLGYLAAGPVSRLWTPELDRGPRALIEGEGQARASAIVEDQTVPPGGRGGWISGQAVLSRTRAPPGRPLRASHHRHLRGPVEGQAQPADVRGSPQLAARQRLARDRLSRADLSGW